MADLVIDMLHRVMGAFMNADAELAAQIPDDDDSVDDYYNQIYRDMINGVIAYLYSDRPRKSDHLGGTQPGAHGRPGDQYL